ncbi:MAG: ATP-binding protein [Candidatus Nezhaarchaeales archaeon]
METVKGLEELAAKYAKEAIELDQRGVKGFAISKYQRAVEILLKLSQLYPDFSGRRVYLQRATEYQERVKYLQSRAASSSVQEGGVGVEADRFVVKEKPSVKWEDVADLQEAKKAIMESLVYPVKRPELFPLGWPKGILFYGPPGCGKTLLAAAVCSEIDAEFLSVDAASIMSKWLGEAEKNVAALFNAARQSANNGCPAIIFIDEVDSLIGIRREEMGSEVRVRNQFLKEMDGVLNKGKNEFVYVIGATNKPWSLDEAFLRRFQRRIYIPPPSYEARLEMLKLYLRNLDLADDVSLEGLAIATDGYSGSDIASLCQEVQIKVVSELFEKNVEDAKPRKITMKDFEEVLGKRNPSISRDMIAAYESWNRRFGAL